MSETFDPLEPAADERAQRAREHNVVLIRMRMAEEQVVGWRERAEAAEARVRALEPLLQAARAVVRYNGRPPTWNQVWRALEQAVAALDEGKGRSG